MKRRVCQQQSVMLETRLNIHISRCENKASKYYLTPVNDEICISCPQRNPVGDEDEIANSMAEYVYAVAVNERSDFIVPCVECPPE